MRTQVSSSLTIFWKYLIPVFSLVMLLTFTFAITFSKITISNVSKTSFFILMMVITILWAVLFYLTIFKLKRVELDEEHAYVTNYFKWYRYTYNSIDKIVERDYVLFKVVTIHLKDKGYFGKKMFFLANHRKLNDFLQNHPNVLQALFDATEGKEEERVEE